MPKDPYAKQYRNNRPNLEALTKHVVGLTKEVGSQRKRLDRIECTLSDLYDNMGRIVADKQNDDRGAQFE